MPKVSIIVPIYNVEKYIHKCIDSIINQTLKDIEIILVDDESPDNCPRICDEYAQKDNRIKVVHKKNGGLGFARNSGLEIATGEYIAFVDSDDYIDITMYETLYNVAKEHDLDTCYSGYNNVTKDRIIPIREVETYTEFCKTDILNIFLLNMIGNNVKEKADRRYAMSVWHAIYSNEIIQSEQIRFCSERDFISEDIVFDIDYLSKCRKIGIIPNTLYFYRANDNSLSRLYRLDRVEKNIKLYNYINSRIKELMNGLEPQLRCMRMVIGYNRYSIRQVCKSKQSFKIKIRWLKDVCNNLIWEELSCIYPYKELPLKYRIFFQLTKNKYYYILYFLSLV